MIKAIVVGVLVAVAMGVAAAQPADVPALIKLVETQPADLDRSAWKEKRRDAAKKLAQSKDKRAVPVLIKLADSETFDIIGEIAIEGLGTLNDQSAVPVLQKIANDGSRDKAQRDLAKKALGRLRAPLTGGDGGGTTTTTGGGTTTTNGGGTTTTTGGGTTTTTGGGTTTTTGGGTTARPPRPPATGGGTTTTTGDTVATGGGKGDVVDGGGSVGGGLLDGGNKPSAELPELPSLPDDTLAAWERMTFVLGTAQLAYDTVRERSSFDFDVAGLYAKRVERERMAYGWDAGAHVIAGYINPDGRAQVRGAQTNITGNAEARFYTGNVYGVGKAALGIQISYFNAKDDDDPAEDDSDKRLTADVQVALGGGYGRLLDVGGAIRVRRLSRTLDAARALGKPIDAATAKKLQLTWWALRGERSSWRALVATVAILREAGILLVEPDAGLSYEILTVLRDSQLFQRPSGLDAQLVFGEGYLIRPDEGMGIIAPSGEEGRVEQALVSVGYGTQLADDKLEIAGRGYARLRLFAPEDQPSPWALGAVASMRKFQYGDHGDPLGAFDLLGELRVSDDDPLDPDANSDLGLRLSGQLGFTWWLNQASGIRLAATAAADGGELFIGAQLSATYGFLDATFAGF
jgi:hypothetical protein